MSDAFWNPCPFCGCDHADNAGNHPFPGDRTRTFWIARCGNPDCAAEICADTQLAARMKWNRRPGLTEHVAMAAEACAALDVATKLMTEDLQRRTGASDPEVARMAVRQMVTARLAQYPNPTKEG